MACPFFHAIPRAAYARASRICSSNPLPADKGVYRRLILARGFKPLHHTIAKEFTSNPSDDSMQRYVRFEHCNSTVTVIPAIRKPFNAPAEGLSSKKSRGDLI
jgi:hypothetical protein